MMSRIISAVLLVLVAGYTQAAGNAEAGKTKSAACQACHGATGNSVNPQWPKLAGQHGAYIAKQLADFKSGARKDPTMVAMVATLSEEDMQDIAAFYEKQTVEIGAAAADKIELGQRIYRGGNGEGVPACMGCHGPSGAGNPGAKFPAVSGQHATYTIKALKDFRSSTRENDMNSMMRNIARKMSDEEINAVAEYISGLH